MFHLNILVYLTYTVIFAVNVFQIVAILALAVVAAKGVHTLSVVWAEVLPSYTFINICRETKQRISYLHLQNMNMLNL